MTAPALLDALAARGVVARVEAGDLKLRPARSLDAEMLAAVRANKADLMTLLTAPQAPGAPPSGLVHISVAIGEWYDGILCGDAYDPRQATAAAWRDFRRGDIDEAQRDFRLKYAESEVSHVATN